jgi:hypothetical protein
MRIVATSDTHFPVKPGMIPFGDVFLHCGDLMQNGYPSEWPDCLDWLNELPHKVKIITFGNHDFHPFLYPGPSLQDLRKIGVTVLGYPGNSHYYAMTLPNNMVVAACPYVNNLPRWAFNASREQVVYHLEQLTRLQIVDIMMTHMPIYGVLDTVNNRHTGSLEYQSFLIRQQPPIKYWFCGHIHEGYGHYIDDEPYEKKFHNPFGRTGCNIYNVAMCNRLQQHVNKPVVIDV